MKRILLIVLILIFSSFAGVNHNTASSSKDIELIEIDRISTTIEVDPMSSYYFHIENSEIKYITSEKIPVMDALKRVPNWLRGDLEKNFEKMAYVDVDVGEHASPTLFDIDNDDDFDLVVGTVDGKIYVYENSNNVWIKNGCLNDSNNNPIDVGDYAVPTFYDLYNDGKTDLIVGAWDGRIRYYENTTEGFVYEGYLKDVNNNVIDVGSYSAPTFGWIVYTCRVGDPSPPPDFEDMLIGAGDGRLYRYERTYDGWIRRGTLDPEVCPPSEIETIDVGDNSKPVLVNLNKGSNEDKGVDLTIGAEDGSLHHYWNTGNDTVTYYDPVDGETYEETRATWSEDDSVYKNFETDAYSVPTLADLDRNKLMTDDCLIDIAVGRDDGHIHLYKNVGSSSNPGWDVFQYAAESVDHHMKYRNLSYVEEYVDLILDVENEYVDEIAFCIAHTSVDVLTDDDVYLNVFKKNAELIYEINKTIQYASLVEEGNYSTGNYWTTIKYNYSEGGVLKNTTLPPDVYYWFVVHPKITDEIPTFINPETGRPDEDGVFWREYLFYHTDENYPSDPDVDDNNDGTPDNIYPREEKPPLLKDKIADVTLMYDSVSYSKSQGYNAKTGKYDYPDPRTWEWSYANHPTGIEIVSNWVKRTLPLSDAESDDNERPIQPVRIAHHHNGNCGELQDLTVAAARTCLIPAAGVCLHGEDHVWAEFYERGWHQWDNQWGGEGGGSIINNFSFLGSERGGAGIFKWWGDDSITDVTECYVPDASTVKIRVTDTKEWAVDGAKVIVSIDYAGDITGVSSGFAAPGQPLPCIWGYTNSEGICEFRLAYHNFKVSVKSKLGTADKETGYIGTGEEYEIPIELAGTKPRPEPKTDTSWSSGTNYKIDIEYEVMYGEVNGENEVMKAFYGIPNEHPEQVSANIDFFICTKSNMEKYLKNKDEGFKYDQTSPSGINQTSSTLSLNIGDDTYIVFSNDDSVETKKIINVTITLKNPEITVSIDPVDTLSGTNATVNGTASTGTQKVWVRIDDRKWENANGTESWNYEINTTRYYPGEHIIYARAWDGWDYAVTYTQVVFLNDLPIINILSVYPISDNMVQGVVSVDGTVSSVNPVQKVEIRIGDANWKKALLDKEGWNWNYDTLDTTTVNDGNQKIYVKAFNGIMYTVASVEVIVDNTPPAVNILSLSDNDVISGNIIINGNASDVNRVKKIEIRIDEENWTNVPITSDTSLTWDYPLDTTNMLEGKHIIYASAFDGLHYHNITVNITVDNNKPPEILYSPTKNNIAIKENSTQEFRIVNAVDSDGNISAIKWYLDGIEIAACANQTSYKFVADYDSSGSYQIKVEVWDDFWNKEAKIRIWNLTVENVNRAPVIESFTPAESAVMINEGGSKTFSIINASDPDGAAPAITWYRYLNGESAGEAKGSGNTYTYHSDYDSAGIHTVKAVISDGEASISQVWVLTVNDVNRVFAVDGFSPSQAEFEMKKESVKTFSVINPDDPENNLTIKWYLNGKFMENGDSYTFIPSSSGTYIVSVILSDGNKTLTNQWTVSVKGDEQTPGFELLSLLMILGVLVVLRKIKRKL